MSALILVFPSCRERCVTKQEKSARDLLTLIKKDLKTRPVSLEVFVTGMQADINGW